MYQPTKQEIERVMRETGMEELQARRHLQQRHELFARMHPPVRGVK